MMKWNPTSLRSLATSLILVAALAGSGQAQHVYRFTGAVGTSQWSWGLSSTRIQCESFASSGASADDAEAVVATLVEGINALQMSGVSAAVLSDPTMFALEEPGSLGLHLDEGCPTELSCQPQLNQLTTCMYSMQVEEVDTAEAAGLLGLVLDPLRGRRIRPDEAQRLRDE